MQRRADRRRDAVTERRAARALLLAPGGQVLLIQAREPAEGTLVWLTPGGGLHPGELPAQCVEREVREETGLVEFEVGPHAWIRNHTFRWGNRMVRQREDYFLVETRRFEPTMEHNPEANERSTFLGFRWWSFDELEGSSDLFVPRRIGEHARRLAEHGPPQEPIDVGV